MYNRTLSPIDGTLTKVNDSIILGSNAGKFVSGTHGISSSILIGTEAAISTSTQYPNAPGIRESVIIGHKAASGSTYIYNDIIIGAYAGTLRSPAAPNLTGDSNILVGYAAGLNSSLMYNTVAIGDRVAQGNTSATDSVIIGRQAGTKFGNSVTNGDYVTLVGAYAGADSFNINYSTIVGYDAGDSVVTGRYSVMVGNLAGLSASNADNSIFIGYSAGARGLNRSGIRRNNIIIGTNISLPDETRDSINLGGVIFATGSYYDSNIGTQFEAASYTGSAANGRVGIGVFPPSPNNRLHIQGSVTASSYTSSLNNAIGFFGTSSWANNATSASAATSITFTPATASFATTASAATSITFVPTTASYALSGSWLRNKAGNIVNTAFIGSPRKAAVNFTNAFLNANYAVVITGEDAVSWTVEGKVAGGFTASANSNIALTGTTYWIATSYGET